MKKNYYLLLTVFLTVFYVVNYSKLFSQLAINTSGNSPHTSSALDIDFSNRGLLIPRVSLTQTTSASPITSPATSLLIYNTATVNDVTPGYYYWDGTKWIRFLSTDNFCNSLNYVLKTGTNNSLVCSQIFDNGTHVGIGTTTPSVELEVRGSAMLYNTSTDGARFIWRGGTGGTQEFRARVGTSGHLGFFPIELGNPGYIGEPLIITQSGRVGINNVINPNCPLHVGSNGASNTTLLALSDNQKTLTIAVGTNLGGLNNTDGIAYYEITGNEFHMFGGHVLADNNTRDLGTTARRWRYLYVDDVYFGQVGTWFSSYYWSDIRFKKDIKPLNTVTNKVLQLKPVTFNMRTSEFPDKHLAEGNQIGLIAQEVESIFPELVRTNDEGYKIIDYIKISTILIKAFQEQNQKMEELEIKLKQIEKQNMELKEQLHSLQKNK